MRQAGGEIRNLVGQLGDGKAVRADSPVTARMADLQDQVRPAEERAARNREELAALEAQRFNDNDGSRLTRDGIGAHARLAPDLQGGHP